METTENKGGGIEIKTDLKSSLVEHHLIWPKKKKPSVLLKLVILSNSGPQEVWNMTPGSEVTQNWLDLLDECVWEKTETGFQSNHVFMSFHVGYMKSSWVSCFWSNFFEHEKAVLPFKTSSWVDKTTNLASCPVSVWKLACGADVKTEPCSLTQAFVQSLNTCAVVFSKAKMDSASFDR